MIGQLQLERQPDARLQPAAHLRPALARLRFERVDGRQVVLLRIGRWLLPWAFVLAVAASLAYAADEALVYRLSSSAEQARTAPPAVPDGQRWIELRYRNEDGT